MRLPASEPDEGLNLTPVIDVVFLLLIFFLVATRFDQEEEELDIDLPEAVQAQPISMTPELVVNINQAGGYTVYRKAYDDTQLLALLQEAHRNNPHLKVRIRGDASMSWKYGVTVMGLCNKAQIRDYTVSALEAP
jgi:biopolymer transport protein ExbD